MNNTTNFGDVISEIEEIKAGKCGIFYSKRQMRKHFLQHHYLSLL